MRPFVTTPRTCLLLLGFVRSLLCLRAILALVIAVIVAARQSARAVRNGAGLHRRHDTAARHFAAHHSAQNIQKRTQHTRPSLRDPEKTHSTNGAFGSQGGMTPSIEGARI